jgi:hypothetical protein
MYTLAFTSGDINYVVNKALETVPAQSEFYQCIRDVIAWHKKYPGNWKQTWLGVQEKWANDIGCPEGVFAPFNIDAKVNAAYVVMGLLYGGGDFTRSLEISTRCGQDADCNPSTVGGILGAILGYNKIPAYWKRGLQQAEDIDFKYTTMSLNDVYGISYKQALRNIERNGGKLHDGTVTIVVQQPAPVKFEKSFEGQYPVAMIPVKWNEKKDEISFDFDGTGFVLKGDASQGDSKSSHVFNTELWLDGKLVETPKLPVSFTTRRYELAWKYQLVKGHHTAILKILNPSEESKVRASQAIVYSDAPVDGMLLNINAAKK